MPDLGEVAMAVAPSVMLARLEIPRGAVVLGREIGRGEFGVVMDGTASGLEDFHAPQRVAIKMLPPHSSAVTNTQFIAEAERLMVICYCPSL